MFAIGIEIGAPIAGVIVGGEGAAGLIARGLVRA
jgi:hypothetical protein